MDTAEGPRTTSNSGLVLCPRKGYCHLSYNKCVDFYNEERCMNMNCNAVQLSRRALRLPPIPLPPFPVAPLLAVNGLRVIQPYRLPLERKKEEPKPPPPPTLNRFTPAEIIRMAKEKFNEQFAAFRGQDQTDSGAQLSGA